MTQTAQYGSLGIADLVAAARLAVFAHVLRGLQAFGPDTPTRHAVHISFDLRTSGVIYPRSAQDPAEPVVMIILQHQYTDLNVGWDGITVTLSFRGQPHSVHIPFEAIVHIAENDADLRMELPATRSSLDFRDAFHFALATLKVFQWGTDATRAELEGRAMFALLPAIVHRISQRSVATGIAEIVFDTGIIGVTIPPCLWAIKRNPMSFTLSPGDSGVRVRLEKFMVECEGDEGENWMVVPFVAVQKITIPSQSLTLPFFPGPVADPLPGSSAPVRDLPGNGLDLTQFGKVTSPSRFPPGSLVQAIWEAGQFCLSGYVGRHSIPGLRFPEDLRARVPLGPSTSLEILVFDEQQHNAVAFKRGHRYCVGIYHGLIETVLGFAIELWMRPDVAPWIGDVSRLPPADDMAEIPDGLEALQRDGSYFRDVLAEMDTSRLQPAAAARARQRERTVAAMDPVRRMALQQCIDDAFRYIWLHEIGHVIWGHVDLVDSSTGAIGMSELDDACGDAFPPELGQFLEFQTDKFAFGSVLNFRVGELERAAKGNKLDAPGRGMPAFVDQATIAIMGCVITQLIFAVNLQLQGRDDVAGTHPPIWLRVSDMISEARSTASSLDVGDHQVKAAQIDKLLQDNMTRAVGSIISTHPMLASVFRPLRENVELQSLAYANAFEGSLAKWDAVVRPYYKFYRGDGGKAALRD